MSAIDGLLRLAKDDGVTISGIAPAEMAGRGVGFVAKHDLKVRMSSIMLCSSPLTRHQKGYEIMHVPINAIRSLHTVPKNVSSRLPRGMSVHGLLAAELAIGTNQSADWFNLVPKWTDLEAGLPALWPTGLRNLLPTEAKHLLNKQLARFECDWKMFQRGFPSTPRQDYLYTWLLVNTRTFYYETPAMLKLPWHDRLALLPVADLFNHASVGCSVSFSTEGYSFTTDRPYRAGAEISTSYGDHSNDFLLVEYGFILEKNRWDKACLDDLIAPKLSASQMTELKGSGFTGQFMVDSKTKRGNTWAALRLLCCVKPQWRSYVSGHEDAEGTLAKAVDLLVALSEEYLRHIEEALIHLGALKVGKASQQKLLGQRWEQLDALVKHIVKVYRNIP
jgi:hypothetical protein